MVRVSRSKRRLLLKGWIKWAALPIIPFCVLFVDTWLNIQVRINDYALSTLSEEQRDLEAALTTEISRLAQLRGINDVIAKATQMGLVAPEINQFQTIAYREIKKTIPLMLMDGFETAQVAPAITTIKLAETKEFESSAPEVVDTAGEALSLAQAQKTAVPAVPMANNDAASLSEALSASREQASLTGPEDPDLHLLTVEDMLTAL
ncbi:MAG: hypothetical protein GXY07_20635 [Candidatus Hydrogenedentes bacterium]|nr:hypothetical protein [Candidatus Hydrogenedentota bacterium]